MYVYRFLWQVIFILNKSSESYEKYTALCILGTSWLGNVFVILAATGDDNSCKHGTCKQSNNALIWPASSQKCKTNGRLQVLWPSGDLAEKGLIHNVISSVNGIQIWKGDNYHLNWLACYFSHTECFVTSEICRSESYIALVNLQLVFNMPKTKLYLLCF